MADVTAGFIDYRINILGVRVWDKQCQLISRRGSNWFAIGPVCELPLSVPRSVEELKSVLNNEILTTACQFYIENPTSDIVAVMGGQKDFAQALAETGAQ